MMTMKTPRALITRARAIVLLTSRSNTHYQSYSTLQAQRHISSIPISSKKQQNPKKGWSFRTMAAASQAKGPLWGPTNVTLEPVIPTIKAASTDALSWKGDLLIIGVFDDAFETVDDKKATIKSNDLKSLDSQLGGALTDIVTMFEFSGKKGQCQAVRTGTGNAKFVALCGLGPRDKATPTADWGPSTFQSFGSCIASSAKSNKAKTVAATILGGLSSDDEIKAAAAGKVANGFINGGYEATRFKSKPAPEGVSSLELLFADGASSAAATEAISRGEALARGAMLTRYLVEAPPNVATPTYLAEAAASIAKSASNVMKLKVLEKKDCEKMGMGCYLGVAEASGEPPKFIHLTYTPPDGKVNKTLALVGKGLTFDSGGYNIKAGAGSLIEMMKVDMGGSAAVLGAAKALSVLKPKGVAVHFIIASCENMIAGSGLRPGDILVASNGKTVEVNNTDAEGRLTLADALLYAQNECKAESIIDIATLTGACIVALGNGIGGVWSPDDSMAASINNASKSAGEKVWRMPLEESYADDLKSPIADMKNSGGRWGGAITAALFLKDFVKTDTVSWAHMDIAGPVWNDKLGGATGFGAQTLAQWAAGHE